MKQNNPKLTPFCLNCGLNSCLCPPPPKAGTATTNGVTMTPSGLTPMSTVDAAKMFNTGHCNFSFVMLSGVRKTVVVMQNRMTAVHPDLFNSHWS